MLIFILFQLSVFFIAIEYFIISVVYIAFEIIKMKGKSGMLPPTMPHL